MTYRSYFRRTTIRYAAIETLLVALLLTIGDYVNGTASLRGFGIYVGLGLPVFILTNFLFTWPKRLFLPSAGTDWLERHLGLLGYDFQFVEADVHWYRHRETKGIYPVASDISYERIDNTLIVWGPRKIILRLEERWKREYSRRRWPDV